MPQHQPGVSPVAVGVDQADARIGPLVFEGQGHAHGGHGFARAERTGHGLDAPLPGAIAPGLHADHFTQRAEHRRSGLGRHGAVQGDNDLLIHALALQIFQGGLLARGQEFHAQLGFEQGQDVLAQIRPFPAHVVKTLTAGGSGPIGRRFRLFQPGRDLIAFDAVFLNLARSQNYGFTAQFLLDLGQGLFGVVPGKDFGIHINSPPQFLQKIIECQPEFQPGKSQALLAGI